MRLEVLRVRRQHTYREARKCRTNEGDDESCYDEEHHEGEQAEILSPNSVYSDGHECYWSCEIVGRAMSNA